MTYVDDPNLGSSLQNKERHIISLLSLQTSFDFMFPIIRARVAFRIIRAGVTYRILIRARVSYRNHA